MPYNPFYIENGTGFGEWLKDDFIGHYDNLTLKTYLFKDNKKIRYTIYFGELNLEILKVMEIETIPIGKNKLRIRYSTGEWDYFSAPKTERMIPNWYDLRSRTATRLIKQIETLDFWSHFQDLLMKVWMIPGQVLAEVLVYRGPQYQSWMEPLSHINAEEFAYQISKKLVVLEERLKVAGSNQYSETENVEDIVGPKKPETKEAYRKMAEHYFENKAINRQHTQQDTADAFHAEISAVKRAVKSYKVAKSNKRSI